MSNFAIHVFRNHLIAVSGGRFLHVSNAYLGKANVMRKVLKPSMPKKKYKYYEAPPLLSAESFSKGSHEGKRSPNSKRASVLNKLFMRYITELMATGENSSQFLGHGIQINRVQVTPDFNVIKVFWISNNVTDDGTIAEILAKNAGPLRHELTQLRVAGVVPKIHFEKDMIYVKTAELDHCLAKIGCDIGKLAADYADQLKTQSELSMHLNHEIKEKIASVDSEVEDVYEEPLPVMSQNVLGLNHADIMQRVKAAVKKSKAQHRTSSAFACQESERTNVNENSVQFVNEESAKAERDAFVKFLRQRQLLKSKLLSEKKNYDPSVEYVRQELLERQQQKLNEEIGGGFLDDADDYIEESEKS